MKADTNVLRTTSSNAASATRAQRPVASCEPLDSGDSPLAVRELQLALTNSEVELDYEPIVDSVSGELRGFEAVLCWNHPRRGRINCSQFDPPAVSALMPSIGEWIIRHACKDCVEWPDDLSVSINVSASQLADPTFASFVSEALTDAGLAARRLRLEVSEVPHLSDLGWLTLNQMQSSGIEIGLDASRLQLLPFNKVKINRTLLRQRAESRRSSRLLSALLRSASILNAPIIVDDIQTPQQLQNVRALGTFEIQGTVINEPVRSSAVLEFISAWPSKRKTLFNKKRLSQFPYRTKLASKLCRLWEHLSSESGRLRRRANSLRLPAALPASPSSRHLLIALFVFALAMVIGLPGPLRHFSSPRLAPPLDVELAKTSLLRSTDPHRPAVRTPEGDAPKTLRNLLQKHTFAASSKAKQRNWAGFFTFYLSLLLILIVCVDEERGRLALPLSRTSKFLASLRQRLRQLFPRGR